MMKSNPLYLFASALLLFTACVNKKNKGTCSDGIANQHEKMIDCGGPCPACPTCFDSIRNQGEAGIDCGGGVCAPCASCGDGILNQGETEIDCGGPCNKCLISYPELGAHGKSFISYNNFTIIPDEWYSMRAEVPEGETLRVHMKNTTAPYDGSMWWFVGASDIGWLPNTYGYNTTHSQDFIAKGKISCDLKIHFKGSGTATIEFYENESVSPDRIKNISW